jgi:CCR4-NOT transcription complex subunit 7/8
VKGISPQLFAEYLISSGIYLNYNSKNAIGLVLNDNIKWISFHGGFDFAYLIKMLNGQELPENDSSFYKILNTYFPQFYDVKCMVKDVDGLKQGGLNKLASDLNVNSTVFQLIQLDKKNWSSTSSR